MKIETIKFRSFEGRKRNRPLASFEREVNTYQNRIEKEIASLEEQLRTKKTELESIAEKKKNKITLIES